MDSPRLGKVNVKMFNSSISYQCKLFSLRVEQLVSIILSPWLVVQSEEAVKPGLHRGKLVLPLVQGLKVFLLGITEMQILSGVSKAGSFGPLGSCVRVPLQCAAPDSSS